MMRTKPAPARTSNSADTLPRAPAPIKAMRAAEIRAWPASPIGANRVWREYRASPCSSLCKRHHLLPNGLKDGVDQRLHIDRHRLCDHPLELLAMFGQYEEWGKPRPAQRKIPKQESDRKIAEFKRPDVDEARDRESALLDGMNLRETFGSKPSNKIVDGMLDKLRRRAILAAIERLEFCLPQLTCIRTLWKGKRVCVQ